VSMILHTLWAAFVVAFIGGMVALILSVAHPRLALDGQRPVYVVGNRVFEGETLIGICGGDPPAPASIPPSSDQVDVTWYPECPR